MTTTRQAQDKLNANRREAISAIGRTFPTEFNGTATVVAKTNGRYVTEAGLDWMLIDGVLVSPKEGVV
jgi:hypothetical protein